MCDISEDRIRAIVREELAKLQPRILGPGRRRDHLGREVPLVDAVARPNQFGGTRSLGAVGMRSTRRSC